MSAVTFCHRCPLRRQLDGGVMTCSVDGRDILDHATIAYCPHPQGPRYGSAIQPADWDAVPAATVGDHLQATPVPAPVAVPRGEWPAWAVTVAKFAKSPDRGVGDTLERLINAGVGLGDIWKAVRARLHMPCNCDRDRDRLNVLYPY